MPAHVELSVGIFSVLFIIIAYMNGMDNPWYGSSLCFALGLYYYRYEKRIRECLCNRQKGLRRMPEIKYCFTLAALLLITGAAMILFFVLGNDSVLGNPIARNAASVSFGSAVIVLLYRVRVGNRMSRLLGKCSYEIFLVHPYMMSLLSEVSAESKILYGILVVVLSVIFAFLIHLAVEKIFTVFFA